MKIDQPKTAEAQGEGGGGEGLSEVGEREQRVKKKVGKSPKRRRRRGTSRRMWKRNRRGKEEKKADQMEMGRSRKSERWKKRKTYMEKK